MVGKISTAIMAAVIIAVLLTACAKEPPKCSNEDTFTLVRKILLDQIDDSEGFSEKEIKENLKIDLPRASAFEEKIKKYSCEAKLSAGDTYQMPITYESQLDDSDQHIVTVGGIRPLDLLHLESALIESIKKSRAGKDNTSKPADAPPTNASKIAPDAQGLNFTEPSEIKPPLKTRFGVISINEEKILLFNGQPLSPSIQGNNSLHLADYNEGEKSDVLLVQDIGGTGCPAQYYFVSISSDGAKPSKDFGTCSDILETAKKGEEIHVSMPGSNEDHVFSFSGGNVLDNVTPIK